MFCQFTQMGVNVGLVTICMVNRARVHIPASIAYQFFLSYASLHLFYEQDGQEKPLEYVYQKKLGLCMSVTVIYLFIQYVTVIIVKYFRQELHGELSQLTVVKMSLKVIVNHINQAIILKTEKGSIGFCNDFGLSLVKTISNQLFQDDEQLDEHFINLQSINLLVEGAF